MKGRIKEIKDERVNECLQSPAAQTNPSNLSLQTLKSIIYRHSDRHLYTYIIYSKSDKGFLKYISTSC